MPLPRLLPGFFYLFHLIFYPLPPERAWFFGVGMAGIAIDFKVFY